MQYLFPSACEVGLKPYLFYKPLATNLACPQATIHDRSPDTTIRQVRGGYAVFDGKPPFSTAIYDQGFDLF